MLNLRRITHPSALFKHVAKRFNGTSSEAPAGELSVLFEEVGPARVITLNRPKVLNALNLDMIQLIYPQMRKWEVDLSTGFVLLKGAGEKAFCAGGDVLSVTESYKEDGKVHKAFFLEEYSLNHLIGSYRFPVISFIDGITMGGGCGLSVHGTFRVATERTLLAMPETALGFFPDVGGSYFLPRLTGQLGIFLALTGHRLTGSDVFHSGIATHYVESAKLPELEDALRSVEKSKTDKNNLSRLIASFQPKTIPEFTLRPHIETIDLNFHGATIEDVLKRLEKHGDEFSLQQLAILKKHSPTSLKVTFEQMKRGAASSFADVFTMEHRMTHHFLAAHDFHEGVRAILIDKDRNPKWKPATLEEVCDETVTQFFHDVPNVHDLILV